MNEIVKLSCSCDMAYNKDIIKQCIANNTFSIFGNMQKNHSILLRYYGNLCKGNSNTKLYLYYAFDNNWTNKTAICLDRCIKSELTTFCTLIDLENHNKISLTFLDEKGNFDLNSNSTYDFEIVKDPITDLMQRYGFEENKELPAIPQKDNTFIVNLNSLFCKIKKLFSKTYCKSNI